MRSLIPNALFCPCLALLAALGCSNGGTDSAGPPPTAPSSISIVKNVGPGFFRDVVEGSGIDHVYRNGQEAKQFAILESLGGGIVLIDYDRDGLLDVFLTGGGYFPEKSTAGHPCKLYRSEGNWRFKDVTASVGLDGISFYSHGGAVGDYDNDGWPDLLVTGYGRLALCRNEQGKFRDVTKEAGLLDDRPIHWSTSAGFADFDGDGHLDLYVTHYVDWHPVTNNPECRDASGDVRDVCSPKKYNGLLDAVFLNQGNGTFRDVTKEAGVLPGKGLGVVIADVNQDGKPDVYVANDTTDNYLYENRSERGKIRFEEVATQRNAARGEDGTPTGSMGVDVADYDGSGNFSIFVTNYQHEAHGLYQNRGPSKPFRHASIPAGIVAIQLIYVGWGTGFIDFDNDGAEDIFISNGHVVHYPPPPGTLKQRATLLRNLHKPGDSPHAARFEEVSRLSHNQAGPFFLVPRQGRGAAFGDLDNDGKVDVVVSHRNEPIALLKNVVNNGHHWLGIALEGRPCRDPVGAVATLERTIQVDGKPFVQKLRRQVKGGGSYASANDHRIVFGLGKEKDFDRLTIQWPSGKTQTFDAAALGADRYWKIVEGAERPE